MGKKRAHKNKNHAMNKKAAEARQGVREPPADPTPVFCRLPTPRPSLFVLRAVFLLYRSVFRGPGGEFLASITIAGSCFFGSG
jgi:hypothetical protein